MSIQLLVDKEIAYAETDAIVNASNGCGWMGGFFSKRKLFHGVAEHLNYYTHGSIEKESVKKARRFHCIPAWLLGALPGTIFVTSNHGLKCTEVIHAGTMHYPGTLSSYKKVRSCLNEIFRYCQEHKHQSVAIPLLGCGTGRLKAGKVLSLIQDIAKNYEDIQVFIYSLRKIK